ncbi:hypothetical protein ARMGADRAFT_560096 [Armillaria gallica]|uniref:Uncharacterized protein n=1 Tax=Armillaria gallica TaxID=47427 RepID=A0A2H3CUT4_ARMGA|nr:hypothetical protein ARMGADRAFT_560096 [Armillaria gallica]
MGATGFQLSLSASSCASRWFRRPLLNLRRDYGLQPFKGNQRWTQFKTEGSGLLTCLYHSISKWFVTGTGCSHHSCRTRELCDCKNINGQHFRHHQH